MSTGTPSMVTVISTAALLAVAVHLFAQGSKPQIEIGGDGFGGKITRKTWDEEGKHHVEEVHTNGKGKLIDKRTTVSAAEGTTTSQLASKSLPRNHVVIRVGGFLISGAAFLIFPERPGNHSRS